MCQTRARCAGDEFLKLAAVTAETNGEVSDGPLGEQASLSGHRSRECNHSQSPRPSQLDQAEPPYGRGYCPVGPLTPSATGGASRRRRRCANARRPLIRMHHDREGLFPVAECRHYVYGDEATTLRAEIIWQQRWPASETKGDDGTQEVIR
jgi:hypothetical protein